jgi:NADPH-dependent curcumin reductase CurA
MSTAVPEKYHEIHVAEYVTGDLTVGNFEIVDVATPKVRAGEVLVRAEYLALFAAFKDLMREDCTLPMPRWRPGMLAGAGGIGTVVQSSDPGLAVGDLVQTQRGWGEYWAGPAHEFFKVDQDLFPSPQFYLSQGPTAYYGIADIAQVTEDDVVFVSGAAGGVGSLAGQVARCRGAAKVIGSVGSQAKADYVVSELGFDAAFDYHDGPVVDHLRRLAPKGISVFFDTVGGEQFEAAVQAAAPHARFALCGALAGQVGGGDGGAPRLDLLTAICANLEIRPFACYHTPAQIGAWYQHFGQWLGEGRFVFPHSTIDGELADVPEAFLAFLSGQFRGNVAVQLTV